jgi:hypothetical protein
MPKKTRNFSKKRAIRSTRAKPGQRTQEFSVRYSPRINRRFVRMVERIAGRNRMPKDEVLRYGFEAAVLWKVGSRKCEVGRKESDMRALLDGMVTVRTTEFMARKVEALFRANRGLMQADVLRGLLERILPIARDKGMAHVMKMREKNL